MLFRDQFGGIIVIYFKQRNEESRDSIWFTLIFLS